MQLRCLIARPQPLILVSMVLFSVLLSASKSQAQQQRFGSNFQRNSARFIEPPRSLRQQIRDAEMAIEEERYSDAIVVLGDLLERSPDATDDSSIAGQDFFLGVEDHQGQRLEKSILRHCSDLLRELPEQAMQIYELRYGAMAKRGLEQATADRDWKLLAEVRQKYFHTVAGYQASLLLAQRELYRGHPLSASMLLDDVVTSRHAIKLLGPEVIALHAVACRLGGRSLPRELANRSLSIAVDEGDSETVRDWRQWIDEHYKGSATDSIVKPSDYRMLGGALSRNETSEGQMPLTTPRWMLVTTATPLDESTLHQKSEDLAASGQLPPPSWSPLLVGDQLLMRTTERLRGVDHRTGKRVWQYPWADDEAATEDSYGGLADPIGSNETSERLARTVFHDIPYGQISSDGKHVFLLDDLMPSRQVTINPLIGVQGAQPIESARNTLVALDLATEGKIRWRLGQNGTVESELNEAFFLGPPLAFDGDLYCLVELSGDIILACIAPSTGEMRWKQQLIAVEGAAIGLDPARRVSGCLITYHEGVLICPTGTGATIAFNLIDRTLRWANSYERRVGAPVMIGSRRNSNSAEQSPRWHSSLAIANGNRLLVTPATTDNLFCYSLVDGKQAFSKPRQDSFYVAGVRENQFLVVGPRQVTSYGLDEGRLQWQTDAKLLSTGNQIIGRGVFGDGFYIVPTSGNELIKLSLDDGSVVERRKTSFPLGNLVAIDGEIIAQGATALSVAYGQTTLGPRVERLLEEDPNNLDALVQKALLLAEQQQRGEALNVLRQARQIDPESDDVLLLSIGLMLDELRENPSPPESLERDLEQIIDTPTQRLEFLALRLEASLRHKDLTVAAQRLLELSSIAISLGDSTEKDSAVMNDSARDCNLDSWLAARASELAALAEESNQREQIQNLVDAKSETLAFGSSKELISTTQHLRALGRKSLVRSAVDRLIEEENELAAERLLYGPRSVIEALRESADAPQDDDVSTSIEAEDRLRLAKIYEQGKMYVDAQSLLDSLSDSQDDAFIRQRDQLKTDLAAELADKPTIDAEQTVTVDWQHPNTLGISSPSPSQYVVRPTLSGGQSFEGWTIANLPNAVMFQTPDGRYIPMPTDEFRSVRNSDRTATISGGIMISERPGRISAIDMMEIQSGRRNDALLWTRDFGGNGSNYRRQSKPTAFGDTIYSYPTHSVAANVNSELRIGPVLGDRLLVLHSGDLLAINITDKSTMWRNSDAPPIGHMVTDGGRVAVVSQMPNVISSVTLFDLHDGRKLETRDWEYGEIWTSCGKYVLAYEIGENRSSATVRLVNPFDDSVVLETEAKVKQPRIYTEGSGGGRLLQDRYMVLFDNTGRLVIWDLPAGKQICEHETGELTPFQSMHAIWMRNRIVVLAAKTIEQSRGSTRVQQADFHFPAHRLISVDLRSGDLQWQRELERPWGITIHQPFNSPVLLMSRLQTLFTVNRSIPKLDLAMVRLSDGKTVHEQLEQEVQPRASNLSTTVMLQPSQNQIRVQVDSELITYSFGKTEVEEIEPYEESDTDQ
ncbi:PQQ-binding-like beta-propeller repeat protein [Roseiconus lacunae]|uniref:PQQ-binding-like beta-propeller repeat protein n=1 Tax=Roseiconus lacunae TaxID=2605694 RepID=A0ABT7PRZ4_9BACT|nr:PQQ-binding-like beta-propeller repeat protein [Roseiconus lacunae]MDM4019273.1 PQQ-binding-like beta-propeller repeat protein [Roseiconus lacunae]